jgi:hypothetical protein
MSMLESAQTGKHRAGRTEIIRHLTGNRLTQRQAIKAKCYDCNGMGESNECDVTECSLHPYSPYGGKRSGNAQK